jgi:hypothetical protein
MFISAFGRGAGWNVTLLLVGGAMRGLHLVTAHSRTAGHQLWFYQSKSKMATESVLEKSVKLRNLERPSAREPFIVVYLI